MTVVEKKNRLKNLIDSLTNNELEQVYNLIESLTSKDKKRIEIVKQLLNDEKELFEKLAQ